MLSKQHNDRVTHVKPSWKGISSIAEAFAMIITVSRTDRRSTEADISRKPRIFSFFRCAYKKAEKLVSLIAKGKKKC